MKDFICNFVTLGALFTAGLAPNQSIAKPAVPEASEAIKPQVADKLQPHKAIYDIKMVSKKSGAQITNVSGQMFYEWEPVCDAWITDHRFNITYEYPDSPSVSIASDFSTYETMDGKNFDYNSTRKRGSKLLDEIRGSAEIGDDGRGLATYTIPEGLSFELDKGALFPVGHTIHILESAKNGDRFLNNMIFDGSDEEGPIEINTFISGKVNAMADIIPSKDLDTQLINTTAYKVRMAFFPLLNKEEDADYEIDMIVHENGVMSHMLIEYRDFTLEQKLIAIEETEKADCTN